MPCLLVVRFCPEARRGEKRKVRRIVVFSRFGTGLKASSLESSCDDGGVVMLFIDALRSEDDGEPSLNGKSTSERQRTRRVDEEKHRSIGKNRLVKFKRFKIVFSVLFSSSKRRFVACN